jgi:antitoxin VapB
MVYIIGSYQRLFAMTTAKLFKSGRSQAVRLPKEFRFEGKEVRIRRHGLGVLLEPTKFDAKAWFEAMDRHRGDPIFPNGREQPPMQERDFSGFDE